MPDILYAGDDNAVTKYHQPPVDVDIVRAELPTIADNLSSICIGWQSPRRHAPDRLRVQNRLLKLQVYRPLAAAKSPSLHENINWD